MFQVKRTKTQKGIILGGLVLFFCLLASEAAFAMGSRPSKKDPPKSIAITGHVTDKISAQPIAGVSVKMFNISGQRVGATTTDGFGNYILVNTFAMANYSFRISAKNYNTISTLCLVKTDKTNVFNFVLTPKTIALKITSLFPGNHSIFAIGENINISVTTSTKDKLQYRYSLDEKVIKDWCDAAAFTFNPATRDSGRHIIKVEVKNTKGSLDSQSTNIYIVKAFPKPEG